MRRHLTSTADINDVGRGNTPATPAGRPEVVEQQERRGREVLKRDESRSSGRLVEVAGMPVPARGASVLGLPMRAKVLMRRFLAEENGEAIESVSAHFPAGLVEGTEPASADALSGSVREHVEARKKVRYDHVTERVSVRLPERGKLRFPACRRRRSHKVLPMVTATVREWHDEEGWGVLDSPETPGGCWGHFSHIQVKGFRTLSPGQQVDLQWEAPGFEQDGYSYRAVNIVPRPA